MAPDKASANAHETADTIIDSPAGDAGHKGELPSLAVRPAQSLKDRVPAECRDSGDIENVRAEGDEPSILEEERLCQDDRGHGEHGGHGPQQNGEECSSNQVTRRASQDGEVQHLRGKGECREHPHQRHQASRGRELHTPGGVQDTRGGESIQGKRHAICQEAVRDVHGA